ncbi:MAG: tryptophan--tRNA ligase, partial [Thermoplasmata archaeon]|nr:tryptophan--tRNA ligase [Thermoplasmata archaeon]
TGVFLKGDRPESYLDEAEAAIRKGDHLSGVNRPYRAIYTDLGVDDADRIALSLERAHGEYGFFAPSATYHMLMTSLTGGKMSSSQPDSAIFLTDPPAEAARKLRSALTGGRTTAEEQREKGGDPDSCAVFEMLRFHLVQDDAELERVRGECREGERLCGGCKKEAADLLEAFMTDLAERRESARDMLDQYIS